MHPRPDLADLEGRLRGHVARLARIPRPPGSPAHARAAAYIGEQLRQAGLSVCEVPFREAGVAGTNLLTEPVPDRDGLPLLIVGAHYDSLADTPGADDNASGVAALLELARWVPPLLSSGEPVQARLQLVAYDLEEYGLVGSWVHARQVREAGTPLRGMVSLEMLGYTDHRPGSQGLPTHLVKLYPDVGNFIGVCGNVASRGLVDVLTAGLKSVHGLPVEFIAVPGKGEVLPEVRLSDHSSFWDHDLPALMITDTSFFRNPHYHRASDTPDTLDYPFLARVTAGVGAAVWNVLTGMGRG
jgi:Zn-dependent M28 family amino/carboxypeptidase